MTQAPSNLENFEANLDELQKIVASMESQTLPLSDSLKQFSHAMELTKQCQQALEEAEQRIEIWQQASEN